MTRRLRQDYPGAWQHIMNRGIARRPIFEDRECMRFFMSRLAHVVRRGSLEIHSFSCMTTHFHILARSPRGELSEAMQFAQNSYVRWFNRKRRRDGPLFRGRFKSKLVGDLAYRRTLIRYIDQNPVMSKQVKSPLEYPYGSAHSYAFDTGPRWLERSWVEADTLARTKATEFSPLAYRQAFGKRLTEQEITFIEARLNSAWKEPDGFEDLVGSSPNSIGRWMRRKTKLADGGTPGMPRVSPKRVTEVLCEARAALGEGLRFQSYGPVDYWQVLHVALLRDLAGAKWAEMRGHARMAATTAQRRYQVHREWMASESAYQGLAGRVAHSCLGTGERLYLG